MPRIISPARRRRAASQPVPIIVVGDPVMTTSGIEGDALTVVWPVPNRADPSEARMLLVYAAAAGGTPISTISPVPATVPDIAPAYFSAYYNIAGIERESARVQAAVAVPQGPIQPAHVAWTPTWVDPALRQLYTTTLNVTGVGRSDILEWRVVTERFTTAWTNCPLAEADPSTVRSLGTIARPAGNDSDTIRGEPGGGTWPVNEFYPYFEERVRVQLRKKIGADPYTAASVFLKVPPPAGAVQFNATVTAQADIRAAILAGLDETGFYSIGISGDFTSAANPSDLDFTNRTKDGYPLVVTSADRNSPASFKGWSSGQRVTLTGCSNVIFDRLRFDNDQTELMPPTTQLGVSPMTIPSGTAIRMTNCNKIYVINCDMWKLRNPVVVFDARNLWAAFNDLREISEDDFRIYGSSRQPIVQGNISRDPTINLQWALDSPTPFYHPDFVQFSNNSPTTGRRGHFNCKVVGNRMYGVAGYKAFCYAGAPDPVGNFALLDTNGIVGLLVADNFVRTGQANCPALKGCKDVIIRNNVLRQMAGHQAPKVSIEQAIENVLIEDVVASGATFFQTGSSPQTVAQRQAQVTQTRVTVNATAWPATWPMGGNRELAYPAGPNAYLA